MSIPDSLPSRWPSHTVKNWTNIKSLISDVPGQPQARHPTAVLSAYFHNWWDYFCPRLFSKSNKACARCSARADETPLSLITSKEVPAFSSLISPSPRRIEWLIIFLFPSLDCRQSLYFNSWFALLKCYDCFSLLHDPSIVSLVSGCISRADSVYTCCRPEYTSTQARPFVKEPYAGGSTGERSKRHACCQV